MSLPSASSLERAMICAGSQVLPQVRTLPSEAMDKGTAVHKLLENLALGKVGGWALEGVAEEFHAFCAQIDLTGLPLGPSYTPELGLAWDYATGIGRTFPVQGRNYQGILSTEFYGTSDVCGVFDDHVEVWDWKVGFGGKLVDSDQNKQLAFYALALARAHGKNRAIVGLIKIGEDAEVERLPPFELDEQGLLRVESELRALAVAITRAERQMVERGVPDVVEGAHCQYCPAQLHCPARLGLVRKVFGLDIDTIARTLDTKGKAEAYLKASAIEDIATRVKKAIRDSVTESEPIPLGNGNTLVLASRQNKTLVSNHQHVVDVIANEFGPDVARAVVESSLDITQTAIRKALQEHAKQNAVPAAPLYRQMEAALIDAGVMTETESTYVKEAKEKARGQ